METNLTLTNENEELARKLLQAKKEFDEANKKLKSKQDELNSVQCLLTLTDDKCKFLLSYTRRLNTAKLDLEKKLDKQQQTNDTLWKLLNDTQLTIQNLLGEIRRLSERESTFEEQLLNANIKIESLQSDNLELIIQQQLRESMDSLQSDEIKKLKEQLASKEKLISHWEKSYKS